MPPKIATPLPQGPTALEKVEEEMILGANKDSSHKKYASVLRAFEDFCHRFAASQGIQLKYDRALFAVYIKQLAKSNTLDKGRAEATRCAILEAQLASKKYMSGDDHWADSPQAKKIVKTFTKAILNRLVAAPGTLAFTEDIVRDFNRSIPQWPKMQELAEFLVSSGVRSGEGIGIVLGDWDPAEHRLQFDTVKGVNSKNVNKKHSLGGVKVLLHPRAIAILNKRASELSDPTDQFFPRVDYDFEFLASLMAEWAAKHSPFPSLVFTGIHSLRHGFHNWLKHSYKGKVKAENLACTDDNYQWYARTNEQRVKTHQLAVAKAERDAARANKKTAATTNSTTLPPVPQPPPTTDPRIANLLALIQSGSAPVREFATKRLREIRTEQVATPSSITEQVAPPKPSQTPAKLSQTPAAEEDAETDDSSESGSTQGSEATCDLEEERDEAEKQIQRLAKGVTTRGQTALRETVAILNAKIASRKRPREEEPPAPGPGTVGRPRRASSMFPDD